MGCKQTVSPCNCNVCVALYPPKEGARCIILQSIIKHAVTVHVYVMCVPFCLPRGELDVLICTQTQSCDVYYNKVLCSFLSITRDLDVPINCVHVYAMCSFLSTEGVGKPVMYI